MKYEGITIDTPHFPGEIPDAVFTMSDGELGVASYELIEWLLGNRDKWGEPFDEKAAELEKALAVLDEYKRAGAEKIEG